jgi:hypothetical protein
MAPPSPARLYASVGGALLIAVGIGGFFFDRGWVNFVHVGAGALALLAASAAPRLCALCLGLVFLGLAGWGFAEGETWLQWLHLALGLLGLAAFGATAKPGRGSEPRAQAAAESP